MEAIGNAEDALNRSVAITHLFMWMEAAQKARATEEQSNE